MKKQSNIFQKLKVRGLKPAIAALLLVNSGYAQSVSFSDSAGPVTTAGGMNTKKSAVSGYVKQDGVFKLAIDNPEGVRYRISVTDDRGKVWYQETTTSEKFRRLLDLSYPSTRHLKVVVTGSGEDIAYVIQRTEAKYSLEKTVE